MAVFQTPKASRHRMLDMDALRKRRKRNKAAAKQRRMNARKARGK